MPKLTRLHLTGIGHRDAKFHKLGLRFTDDRGQPAHTLLWLPNGGGKSLLIAFKYAALRPHKYDFLGHKTGRGADLLDFVEPGKLAVVLLEYDFPETNAGRRVIGYAALRREHELERWFFTFRVQAPLTWESLPVAGLGPPATTLLKLRQHFQAAHAQDKARIEYFETDNQTRWSNYLRDKIGIDPEVFRHHLTMNSDEGGVIKVFAHKEIDAFVRLFLEMTIEPEALFKEDDKGRRVDQVREAVADYKTAYLENPRRELTRDLCVELIPILRTLEANLRQRADLRDLAGKVRLEVALVKRSLEDHLQRLRGDESSLTEDVTTRTTEKQILKTDHTRLDRWAQGYECLRKRLYFEETNTWQTSAGVELSTADFQVRLLTAARAAAVLRQAETSLATLKTERASKVAALKPELDAIQSIGGQLAHWITERSGKLQRDETDLAESETKARGEELAARGGLQKIEIELRSLREQHKENKGKLAELDQARRKLRSDGLVDTNESAAKAEERWLKQAADLDALYGSVFEQAEQHLDEAESARVRREEASAELTRLNQERDAVSMPLARYDSMVASLRAERGFQAVGGTAETSVWNPTLPSTLESRLRALRDHIVNLKIAGADDQRVIDRYQPPERTLFPPPRDVELVLGLLKKDLGIATAAPAYSELAAAFSQTSDAEAAMRRQPLGYAGIIVQDSAEFAKVCTKLAEAAISRPVPIVAADALTETAATSPRGVHLILPQDRGLWNAAMARADVHAIRERCESRRAEISRTENSVSDIEAAQKWLEQIRREFREEQPAAWRARLPEIDTSVEQAKSRRTVAEIERVENDSSARELKQRLPGIRAEQQAAERKRQQVAVHIATFENYAASWLQRDSELVTAIDGKTRDETAAEGKLARAAEALLIFPARWQEIRRRALAIELDRSRLTPAYTGAPIAPPPGVEPATFWTQFESQIRLYENRVNDEALLARLTAAAEAEAAARRIYTDAMGKDLPPAVVESQSRQPDIDGKLGPAHARHEAAKRDHELAKSEHARAAAECPAELRRHNERETIDEKRPAMNRLEAETLRDLCRAEATAKQNRRNELDDELREIEGRRSDLRETIPRYENLLEKCADVTAADGGKHPEFRADLNADIALVKRLLGALVTQEGLLSNAEKEGESLFKNKWQRILGQDRFAREDFPLRAQLLTVTPADLERKVAEHAQVLLGIQAACDSELSALADKKASAVTKLVDRGELAARRLQALQRASGLPKELDAWGGHPFIKVDFSLRNDRTERAHHLGLLVEKWAKEGNDDGLPSGAELAHACLKALLASGQISLRVLKPTQRLELFYHDITEMAGFSEGQRVTAAILIYCILVRLRRQNSPVNDGAPFDAGYLLLDNPLGKANHTALVDLQLRVARAMGVQLVYASGINDPGALVHFSHVVRLKNNALDPKTGDKLVQLDTRQMAERGTISAVEMGVTPRVAPPPLPPKPRSVNPP